MILVKTDHFSVTCAGVFIARHELRLRNPVNARLMHAVKR